MAKIIWSDLAMEHLREIDSYISKGSPVYSIVFIDRMIAAVERIGLFPKCGRVVPEFGRDEIREILFHNYRIVYLTQGNTVTILAIVHAAMDIMKRSKREDWDLT